MDEKQQDQILLGWRDVNNLLEDAVQKETGAHLLEDEVFSVSFISSVNLERLVVLHSLGLVPVLPWSEEELLDIQGSLTKIALACGNKTDCNLTVEDCVNCMNFFNGTTVVLLPFYLSNPAIAAELVKELEAEGLTLNDLYDEE